MKIEGIWEDRLRKTKSLIKEDLLGTYYVHTQTISLNRLFFQQGHSLWWTFCLSYINLSQSQYDVWLIRQNPPRLKEKFVKSSRHLTSNYYKRDKPIDQIKI